jgi:hypothetical protein
MAATLLIALLTLWALGGALAVSLCVAAARADRRETRPGFAPLRLVVSR